MMTILITNYSMKRYLFMIALIAALLTACGRGNKFEVKGNVAGAGDTTKLYLEMASNGAWLAIDSTWAESDGSYSFAENAPQFPNIYRLRYGEKSIYFPIDSIDRLTINTQLKEFDTKFDVSGSDDAVAIMKIDKDAMKYAKASPAEMAKWKDQLSREIVKDLQSIVAYYAINKYVGGQPLFDPMNDNDMKIIGAVANAYDSYKKDDPRTDYLVQLTLDAQRRRRSSKVSDSPIVAEQISLIDIKLQDANGKVQTLSEVASKGGVVLLNFTMYDQSFSPAFNKVLNDIYTQYKDRGLNIYQVALDENVSNWRTAAKNLPWITVYDAMGENSQNVSAYNVMGVPTTFIIDRTGLIVDRVEDVNVLKQHVEKYI